MDGVPPVLLFSQTKEPRIIDWCGRVVAWEGGAEGGSGGVVAIEIGRIVLVRM